MFRSDDRQPFRDLLVFLPGLPGSVLSRNGQPIFDLSIPTLWSAVSTLGSSMQALQLSVPDPSPEELQQMDLDGDDLDDLGDGIRATSLIQGFHGVFGLGRIDGYADYLERIRNSLRVTPDTFIEFPFDWRRDLRVSAYRLRRVVQRHLRELQRQDAGAKVVLMAHSTGGLVCRYYLEVLGGREDCRALVTFGTPHRGTPKTLNLLVNGYKAVVADFTAVVRSFPSFYQLLPVYPLIQRDGREYRVSEVTNLHGVDPNKLSMAHAFHKEIRDGVAGRIGPEPYATLPVVGINQSTVQSARWHDDGTLEMRTDAPNRLNAVYAGGDGTVPAVSAIPLELSERPNQGHFVVEQHSSLQHRQEVLDHVLEAVRWLAAGGIGEIRGAGIQPGSMVPSIDLRVDDLYVGSEEVWVEAAVNRGWAGELLIRANSIDSGTELETVMPLVAGQGRITLPAHPGVYRVTATAVRVSDTSPKVVHDTFVVAGG